VSQRLSISVQNDSEDETSEIEYPLTPPPSDVSDSRPLSPVDLRSLNLDVSILEIHATIPVEEGNTGGVKQRREQPPGVIIRVLTLSQGKLGQILRKHVQMKSRFMWFLGHPENLLLPALPMLCPMTPSGISSHLTSGIYTRFSRVCLEQDSPGRFTQFFQVTVDSPRRTS
jgi:hypothetical protein